MESIDERIARIEREQCFYPFADCDTKAETKTKDPIGSDPMQYCKKHDSAMRQRYAREAQNNGPVIPFHCPMCATDFGKSQRELNLYGILIECPNCHGSFDGNEASNG